MEKYRKFRYNQKYKFSKLDNDRDIFEKLFTPSEQLMLKQSVINNVVVDDKNLLETYREYDLIHNPIPLH